MVSDEDPVQQVDAMLATTEIAGALESEQFRRFLDKIPVAIAVSELHAREERIVYANPEFERLTGIAPAELEGKDWSVLREVGAPREGQADLGTIIAASREEPEEFCLSPAGNPPVVDVHSHVIENDDGAHIFRLVALVELRAPQQAEREELRRKLMEKDLQLREIQHRVKNNLQMITALIRIESRNATSQEHTGPFNRLAGRIEALHLLYQALAADEHGDVVDLGVYLSQIASAVMQSHGVEGIRLDLKLDAYPVSINVAMPTGLVVNELFTNALKYAFAGRDGGTITLHSLVDGEGCLVTVADDGVGLPQDREWPEPGKLGALIVQSLRENAKADVKVESAPGKGMRVTIRYARKEAAPQAGQTPP